MAGLDPATPPDVHWRGSPRPSGERSARLVERSETPASRMRGPSVQGRRPPACASEPAPRRLGGHIRALLGRHGRARPGHPAARSLARLTSPLRGEVGAPGRAQRDPGKRGEEDFSFVPHRTSRLRQRARPAPERGGHVRPPLGRHGRARPGHPAARSLARLTSPLPGRGRRAWSSAARPRQAG